MDVGRKLDIKAVSIVLGIVVSLFLLFLLNYKQNTEFKSIEVYNANGRLLSTLEGRIHFGFSTYIQLEDNTVMLPNSNFTYIEKDLVD